MGRGATRDNQRSRVYAAEEAAALHGPTFATVRDCQLYVDEVQACEWWKKRYHGSRIVVRDGRGRSSACALLNEIRLPRGMRKQWIILHEVAHVLTGYRVAGHGPEFTRNYLDLVGRFMGSEAARTMRAAFRAHRVRVGPVAGAALHANVRRPALMLHLHSTLVYT